MAATITVTATVQDPSGTALAGNSFLRFRLRNFAGFVPQISGTSILPEIQVDATPTNGLISQALWPNNVITPSTTFYTVELFNQGRITSSGNYIFNASTNLNAAAQVNTPPVPAGFSLVLENNSVLNSSQSTLNQTSADGTVKITDLGNGQIDLSAGTTFTTAGDYFISNQSQQLQMSQTGGPTTGVQNQVACCLLFLPSTFTIKKISGNCVTGSGLAASVFSCAIYSMDGNTKIIDAGANAFTGQNSANPQTVTLGAAVTIPAGYYWFAYAGGNASMGSWTTGVGSAGYNTLVNLGGTAFGKAANAMSAGAMPSTLGAITAFTSGDGAINVPAIKFSAA